MADRQWGGYSVAMWEYYEIKKNNFLIQFYNFITHGSVKSYLFRTIVTKLEKALVLDFYIGIRLSRNKDIGNQVTVLASSSNV